MSPASSKSDSSDPSAFHEVHEPKRDSHGRSEASSSRLKEKNEESAGLFQYQSIYDGPDEGERRPGDSRTKDLE